MRRRNFLKTGGSVLTVAGFMAGSAGARRRRQGGEEKNTLEEFGMRDEYLDLMADGNIEEAHQLLDEQDIPYSHSRTPISEGNTSNGSVSAQAVYDNPDDTYRSSLILDTVARSQDDRYDAVLEISLSPSQIQVDSPGQKDAVSISYSESVFQGLPNTVDARGPVEIDPADDTNSHGVKAKVDDSEPGSDLKLAGSSGSGGLAGNLNGHLAYTIRKRNEPYQQATVYGDYIHTWNQGGVPLTFSLDANLRGPGNLSAGQFGGGDQWDAQTSTRVHFTSEARDNDTITPNW